MIADVRDESLSESEFDQHFEDESSHFELQLNKDEWLGGGD